MEPAHVFYNELYLDKNNVFSANLVETIKLKTSNFKKSKNYAISGLANNQEVNSDFVPLPNADAQNALSDLIRTYSKEKEKFKLDLRFYNEESFDVTIPFKKRTHVLINGFQYYDTTKKNKKQLNFMTIMII